MNTEIIQRIFALLFASDEPLSAKRIAEILAVESPADIRTAIDQLSQKLEEEKYSIKIDRIAGGHQLITRPEYVADVAKLYTSRRKQRLSRAGLETLAIIAYKQPITRADIEQLRGVSCGGVLSTLLERSLIKISGKAKVLGAPFLYKTTQEFLEYLGLNGLGDLPSIEQLEELLAQEEYKDESTESIETAESIEPMESAQTNEPVDMPESNELYPGYIIGDDTDGREDPPNESVSETTNDESVSETINEDPASPDKPKEPNKSDDESK